MEEMLYELGHIKLVQLQPTGLIIASDKTPTGYFYDESRLVEVDQLTISSLGIEAMTRTGEHFLDIHHIDHPDKAYDDDDLICIGFTSHYQTMRDRFGEHLVDGIAGENIIIECGKEVWPEDLGQRLIIQDGRSGRKTILKMVSHANPCQEFSQFALGNRYEKPPASEMKAALQFLDNGRRGFLFVMEDDRNSAEVQAGDKVFIVDTP